MSDLISRKAVLEEIQKIECEPGYQHVGEDWAVGLIIAENIVESIESIESTPSAEPERNKGKWIDISWSEPDPNVCCTSYAIQSAKCSICGKYYTTPYLYSLDYFPYCPNCGAEMSEDE